MELPPILIIIGSYFGMAGGVWALFDRADKALKGEAKKSISRWLTETNPTAENSKWPGQFISIFDSVFGEKHLSWRCFFRSSIASYIAIIILSLVYVAIRGTESTFFSHTGNFVWSQLLAIFLIGAIINLLPDFVSLLETRYIIQWMSRSKSFLKIFGLLCLDLAVSSLLIIGGFILLACIVFLVSLIFDLSTDSFPEIVFHLVGVFESGLSFKNNDEGNSGIFIYSTFFTSVWVWLYGLSGLVIKTCNKIGQGLNWLKNIFDFENRPLPSLGFVSNLIILFIYLIGFGLFYEGNYL